MASQSYLDTVKSMAKTAAEHPDQAARALEGDPSAMMELYSELDPETREALNAKIGGNNQSTQFINSLLPTDANDPKPPQNDANASLQNTAASSHQQQAEDYQYQQQHNANQQQYSSPTMTR